MTSRRFGTPQATVGDFGLIQVGESHLDVADMPRKTRITD